jgi:hypothetical protein
MFGFLKSKSVPSKFIVHDAGTDGNSVYELRVGQEIDQDTAEKLSKISDGVNLYAIHAYYEGEKKRQFVPKQAYLTMKNTLDNI